MSSAVASSAGTAASSSASAQPAPMTAADFLQILVAEFENQDPTSPSDPTQYATQMVEFSNLGQLQNIDSAVTQSAPQELMQASSAYLGREVVAPGNQVGVSGGKATSIEYSPASTDNYSALVFNSSGQQVDSVSLGSLQANSLQNFTWQPPSSVSDGQYSVRLVNSRNVPVSGLLEQGVVQSISLVNGSVTLDLGNLSVTEDQISQISRVAQPQS